MVLDARTLSSFYDLADVLRDYTTPSRGSQPLTPKQKDDACFLRFQHGWHARHIAEAMGLAIGQATGPWQEDILEALDECTTRSDWNSQGIFLRPIQTPEGPDQTTAAGTNLFGDYRRTARENAIIQAATAGEIRTGGRLIQPAGKYRDAKQLAAAADQILSRESRAGHYPGVTFGNLSTQQVNNHILKLGALFDWPGKARQTVIKLLEDEERAKVDAEILRRCRVKALMDIEAGRDPEAPYGFFTRVQREVYATFPCCGPDGDESMKDFGYAPLSQGYANALCLEAGLFKPVQTIEEQVDDPANQKKVKDAIGDATTANVHAITVATGLTRPVVHGILVVLGYTVGTIAEVEAIRAIILPLHDVGRRTPRQMWDETPELRTLIGRTRAAGVIRIHYLLTNSTPPRIPWTIVSLEIERRIPLRAAQLKSVFIAHLRFWDERELARIRGNISRSRNPGALTEASQWGVNEIAAKLGETPELIRMALALLEAEDMPLIAISGDDIVFPISALRWITRGGERLEGEVG